VLVIGGGVIGLTAAYFLGREGVRVRVLDQNEFGREASWAGAGILPPGNPAAARHPYDLLRAHSAELFPTLSAELRERTRIDNGYLVCGGLEFLGPGGAHADEEWRGEGVEVEALDEEAARRVEPALARGLGCAAHLPTMAQVRNPRHLKALVAGCRSWGVELAPNCPLFAFDRRGGHIAAVHTAAGPVTAERYLLTSGAWTGGLLQQLGWQVPVKPIRGQIALLNMGQSLLRRILLWGSRYLVPRPDGRVLVGSTEEDVGFDRGTRVAPSATCSRSPASWCPRWPMPTWSAAGPDCDRAVRTACRCLGACPIATTSILLRDISAPASSSRPSQVW
jgi:glycine oxidase